MKTRSKILLGSALLTAMAALSACSPDGGAGGRINAAEASAQRYDARINSLRDTGKPTNVSVRDGIFLSKDGFQTGRGDPLPKRLEGQDGVSMKVAGKITVIDFAQLLQDSTGMRVDIRDLTAASMQTGAGSGPLPLDDSTGAAGDENDRAAPFAIGAGSGSIPSPLSTQFMVDHRGPLSSLLDKVARQIGADWEYTGGRIKFLGPQTTTYTIWAMAGETKASGSVGGGGTFGSGGAGTVTSERSYEYWADLEAGLASLVPPDAGRYAVNQGSGTIVLTGFQATHERVARFVAQENARLSRQVAVRVDVISFTANNSREVSADLSTVLKNAARTMNAGFSGAGATGDITSAILDKPGSSGDLTGSVNATLNALATQGRVSIVNSSTTMAMNNMPTPVQLSTQKAYVKGIKTTEEDGKVTSEMETGVIDNGLNMTITPRIMSTGDVVVAYHMNISQLKGIEKFEVDGSMVQLPEVDLRNFMQTVTMGSGDSLVIAAYDSQRDAKTGSGPFSPAFWGLGGKTGHASENTRIVVLMTPVIVDSRNAPRASR